MAIVDPVQTAFDHILRKVREAGLNEVVKPESVEQKPSPHQSPLSSSEGWKVLVWTSSGGQQFTSDVFRSVI